MSSIKNFREKGSHLKMPYKEEVDLTKVVQPPSKKEERERPPRNFEETVRRIEDEAVFKI